ncbi:hypothetical protein BX070DRAFT_228634 [Coemansia spiralis]|nr:hypothetical protein BX070DRAFT_228634 [Coemansia spiralis]
MSTYNGGNSSSGNRLRHHQPANRGGTPGGAYSEHPHSSYGEATDRQLLEDDPNDKSSRLKSKISMLKEVTINIGDEIRDQNQFLTTMGQDMEGLGDRLARNMKSLYDMWKRQGCGPFFYLTIFTLSVFTFLYIYLKARK